MKEIEIYWNLQNLDQELNKIVALSKKMLLSNDLQKEKEELAQIECFAQTLCADWEVAKENLQVKELDLQSILSEKKQLENILYGGSVQNTKELERMEEKLQQMKNLVDAKEQEVVTLMEEIEEKENSYQEKERKVEEKRIVGMQAEKKAKKLERELKKKKKTLTEEREKLYLLLSPSAQNYYLNMQKKFASTGVAILKGQVCQGCFMALPTALLQTIVEEGKTNVCDSCGRILYLPD